MDAGTLGECFGIDCECVAWYARLPLLGLFGWNAGFMDPDLKESSGDKRAGGLQKNEDGVHQAHL